LLQADLGVELAGLLVGETLRNEKNAEAVAEKEPAMVDVIAVPGVGFVNTKSVQVGVAPDTPADVPFKSAAFCSAVMTKSFRVNPQYCSRRGNAKTPA
jgi:hypothetical protein